MGKLTSIELTKVHYYDSGKFSRNAEISTVSREVSGRHLHRHPIIQKNIFGHRWVLKINDSKRDDKHKCNVKVILYVLVFLSIILAIGFGIYFSLESYIFPKTHEPRIYPNQWRNRSKEFSHRNGSRLNETAENEESAIHQVVDEFYSKYEKLNVSLNQHFCQKCLSENEICLKNDSIISCVKIKDKKDPTGCGGLCKLNTQHCKSLDSWYKLYECKENKNILKCPEEDFNCGNMCISSKRRCDGVINCSNKSDELNCPCDLSTHFRCGDNTSCIETSRKCDGIVDCWDKSDEINCETKCQKDEIMCKNEQCVKKEDFCDGRSHCLDNSDEPVGCQK